MPRQGAPLYFDGSGSGFGRQLPNRTEEDEEALSPLGAMSKGNVAPRWYQALL